MAFRGVMVVRDEGDIVAQVLAHLLTWVDSLHIFDTGSTDGTWEVVGEFARMDSRIRVLGRERVRFENGLRAMVFDRARGGFRDGDWVARLDADEFYHEGPPEFVRERLGRGDGRVYAQHHEFLLTKAEARAWEEGRETLADRARPIEERRRRFVVQEHPEPRFFRYRRGMKWPASSYVPLCGGRVAEARIAVRHYRWRDPVQAAARCELRRAMREAGAKVGPHWGLEDWRDWLANDEDPRLLTHTPGAPLPEPGFRNHQARGLRAGVRRVMYSTGLARLADGVLPGFDPAFRPRADESEIRFDGVWAGAGSASCGPGCTPTRDGAGLRT